MDEDKILVKYDDLLNHIKSTRNPSDPVCVSFKEQSSTHISQLPMEVILYIFRWVVSSELDLRHVIIFTVDVFFLISVSYTLRQTVSTVTVRMKNIITYT